MLWEIVKTQKLQKFKSAITALFECKNILRKEQNVLLYIGNMIVRFNKNKLACNLLREYIKFGMLAIIIQCSILAHGSHYDNEYRTEVKQIRKH